MRRLSVSTGAFRRPLQQLRLSNTMMISAFSGHVFSPQKQLVSNIISQYKDSHLKSLLTSCDSNRLFCAGMLTSQGAGIQLNYFSSAIFQMGRKVSEMSFTAFDDHVIKRAVTMNDFVHIVGPPGSGLTTGALRLALKLRKKGYFVLE
jgi:hypothetical protein